MDGQSLNITQDIIAKLKEILPAAFTEDKLNIDQLKQLLGENINTDHERYHLDWAGKAEAFKVLQSPTTATLLPDADASVDWDNAQNILIEGENLEALKALQKSYYGKVKMIYIDPPYNTGGDSFIYPDKFSETKEEYLRRIGDKDEEGYLMKEGFFRKNNKENGQFHSNWLNMMMPRLFLARNLLRDDGVIFISIDDNEVHNLRLLMNEIFGEENFITSLIWKSRQIVDSRTQNGVSNDHEYVIVFGKNSGSLRGKEISLDKYSNPDKDERGDWMSNSILGLATVGQRPNLHYDIINPDTGLSYSPPAETGWRYSKETMENKIKEKRIVFPAKSDGRPREKKFLSELNKSFTGFSSILSLDAGYTLNGTRETREILDGNIFSFPKPVSLLNILIEQGINVELNKNDIILDFFAGSGTTAQAVMELNEADGGNRKYICIQLPEKTDESSEAYKAGYKSIADITQARIKKVIEKIQAQRGSEMQFEEKQPLGFRKFTLAPSNFKLWRGDIATNEAELQTQMDMFATSQKAGAQTQNILWELLLKNGMPLTAAIQKHSLAEDAIIYTTADSRLAFVLDKYTAEVQPKLLVLRPQTAIFLDSLFKGQDQAKTNLQLKLEESGITFKTI